LGTMRRKKKVALSVPQNRPLFQRSVPKSIFIRVAAVFN